MLQIARMVLLTLPLRKEKKEQKPPAPELSHMSR